MVKGHFYDRIRYGEENDRSKPVEEADKFAVAHGVCPGCSVLKGQFHVGPYCRIEQCACCGYRVGTCRCEPELGDDTMPHDALLTAAVVSPGFSADLSTWRVSMDMNGRTRQEIRTAGQSRTVEAQVPAKDLAAILEVVEQIKFLRFRPHYSAEITDCATLAISVRISGFAKRVEAYAPEFIASHHFGLEGQQDRQDMQGFVELWERIHRHLPRIEAGGV
jgi:hypothetical protein